MDINHQLKQAVTNNSRVVWDGQVRTVWIYKLADTMNVFSWEHIYIQSFHCGAMLVWFSYISMDEQWQSPFTMNTEYYGK